MSKWPGCPVIACKNDLCYTGCRALKHVPVSKDAMDWAATQIDSPLARNADGSPKTLRQLLNESKPGKGGKVKDGSG